MSFLIRWLRQMRHVCRVGGRVVLLNHFLSDIPSMTIAADRVTILASWTVSTSHTFEHYCRPISAGAANHVTLGELQTCASRPAQRSDAVIRQQGAW